MTTLKSVFEHSPATLTIENTRPGEVYFRTNRDNRPDGDCVVSRAEVLDALGAVDKDEQYKVIFEAGYAAGFLKGGQGYSKLRRELQKVNDALGEAGLQRNRIANDRDAWKTRAEKAEAKLAEAEAAIERVKAWAEDYFGVLDEAPDELRVILVPSKTFELPTKPGAGVMARMKGGDTETERAPEHEFRLFSDGKWSGKLWNTPRTPEQFLRDFTGHRILDRDNQ